MFGRLNAQSNYGLNVFYDRPIEKEIKYTQSFISDSARNIEIAQVNTKLQALGYIGAFVSNVEKTNQNATVYYNIGNKYTWQNVKPANGSIELINASGYRAKNTQNKVVDPNNIYNAYNKVLNYCEQNGYPFASVNFDSISFLPNGVNAVLTINKGPFITMDSIVVKGDVEKSYYYLSSYLDIKKGEPYNHKKLVNIENRLKELPFIKQTQPYGLLFNAKKAQVYLYLKRKKASRFNGVVGFLPDEETGKINLTGDLDLNLTNALNRGENIDLKWRSFNLSQDLDIRLQYPYIFKSPFGVDLALDLYKQDTTFIEVTNSIGLQYLFNGNSYFKAFVKNVSNTVLTESEILASNLAESKTRLYGLGLSLSKLNYKYNPQKGYRVLTTAAVGNKKTDLPIFGSDEKEKATNLLIDYDFIAEKYFAIGQHNRVKIVALVERYLFNVSTVGVH